MMIKGIRTLIHDLRSSSHREEASLYEEIFDAIDRAAEANGKKTEELYSSGHRFVDCILTSSPPSKANIFFCTRIKVPYHSLDIEKKGIELSLFSSTTTYGNFDHHAWKETRAGFWINEDGRVTKIRDKPISIAPLTEALYTQISHNIKEGMVYQKGLNFLMDLYFGKKP